MTGPLFSEAPDDKPAIVMAGWPTMSFGELEAASNRLAHLLRSAGLRRGDHLAFVLENGPEALVVAWAAQRSGLYHTAISTHLGVDEVAYIVEDCGARALVASAETLSVVGAVAAPAVELRLLTSGEEPGWVGLTAATATQPATPIADEAEGADMLYSSGTTGRPKGIKPPLTSQPLPHSGPVRKLVAGLFGAGPQTVYLSPAPLYHAAPLRFTMAVHRLGGTVVLMDHFDAERFLALVEEHRVTFTQVVPTMLVRLLRLPDAVRTAYDLSSLQVVVHAAAPCPIEVKERVIDWLGPIVHEYYGGTEGNGFVHCDSEGWLAHRGSVGRSLLGPLHILDEDGDELPVGETGTIYFASGRFEYHGDPNKTAASRDPQGRGWTTLGDIGHVDDDGYLYLTDRRANMIISGGVNIYPQEAEDVLALHPAVDDVAVFGIPDDDMGERVHAVVQPAAGVEPTAELAAEIIAYCRARLAHLKCPRGVDFRVELPRHPNGKLYKRLLRDEYRQAAGGHA